jgi:hypothetical protein
MLDKQELRKQQPSSLTSAARMLLLLLQLLALLLFCVLRVLRTCTAPQLLLQLLAPPE